MFTLKREINLTQFTHNCKINVYLLTKCQIKQLILLKLFKDFFRAYKKVEPEIIKQSVTEKLYE